jgi:hypothetical protein
LGDLRIEMEYAGPATTRRRTNFHEIYELPLLPFSRESSAAISKVKTGL